MKPRKALVTLTLRTNIPMKWLQDKREWERLLNCFVVEYLHKIEKVDAIKLKD